jgi:nucleoid DNA-binding protein
VVDEVYQVDLFQFYTISIVTGDSSIVTGDSHMPARAKKIAKKPATRSVGELGSPATVTLKHLAASIAHSREVPKKHAETFLHDLVGLLVKHLKKGERVRISGLGSLQVGRRAGRKPAVGEFIQSKASDKAKGTPIVSEGLNAKSTYEPAASAYEPSAQAQALLRGKDIRENDLRTSGGSYTLEHVETLLGISRQAIDKKVRDDALLVVPGPHGRRRYPVVQFTVDGISPGLQDVLRSLPSANGWFRLNFLINPDSCLGGQRPIDLLKEGRIDPVLRAAKAVGVQGA